MLTEVNSSKNLSFQKSKLASNSTKHFGERATLSIPIICDRLNTRKGEIGRECIEDIMTMRMIIMHQQISQYNKTI